MQNQKSDWQMTLIKKIKIYNQLKKKIKKPFLFIVNFYLTTRFKINLIQQVELKNGIKYNLKEPTDSMLILEYAQNYYNIDNIIQNNVCVDVGANSGDFAIFISKKFNKIYAFEPIPKVFKLMNDNIKLNNLKNIKTYNFGLADKTGTLNFDLTDCTGIAKIDFQGQTKIKVISWSKLNTIVGQKINLLKIDCEGGEYSILNDHHFLNNVQEIRMEIHLFNNKNKIDAVKLINLFTNKYQFKSNLSKNEIQKKIKTTVAFEIIFTKNELI
jgi:FkbM family methyltransferase